MPELAELWYTAIHRLCEGDGPLDNDLHLLYRTSIKLATAAKDCGTPYSNLLSLRGATVGLPMEVNSARSVFARNPGLVRLREAASVEVNHLLVAVDLRPTSRTPQANPSASSSIEESKERLRVVLDAIGRLASTSGDAMELEEVLATSSSAGGAIRRGARHLGDLADRVAMVDVPVVGMLMLGKEITAKSAVAAIHFLCKAIVAFAVDVQSRAASSVLAGQWKSSFAEAVDDRTLHRLRTQSSTELDLLAEYEESTVADQPRPQDGMSGSAADNLEVVGGAESAEVFLNQKELQFEGTTEAAVTAIVRALDQLRASFPDVKPTKEALKTKASVGGGAGDRAIACALKNKLVTPDHLLTERGKEFLSKRS